MTLRLASGLLIAVVAAAGASAGPIPKYRVRVTVAPHRDISKLGSYSWLPAHTLARPDGDADVVVAIDRELGARGLTKLGAGGDAVVTYQAMTRTDVKVNVKPIAKDVWPAYPVGTLVVSLLDPRSLEPMLQLRADRAIGAAPIEHAAVQMVAEMFKKYPARPKR